MCHVLTEAEAEGSTIPETVPVEGVVPETQEAGKAATEPVGVASQGAPGWPKRSATKYYQNQASK
jgi:hypothetical protein